MNETKPNEYDPIAAAKAKHPSSQAVFLRDGQPVRPEALAEEAEIAQMADELNELSLEVVDLRGQAVRGKG